MIGTMEARRPRAVREKIAEGQRERWRIRREDEERRRAASRRAGRLIERALRGVASGGMTPAQLTLTLSQALAASEELR